jgi:hypothetical protein
VQITAKEQQTTFRLVAIKLVIMPIALVIMPIALVIMPIALVIMPIALVIMPIALVIMPIALVIRLSKTGPANEQKIFFFLSNNFFSDNVSNPPTGTACKTLLLNIAFPFSRS